MYEMPTIWTSDVTDAVEHLERKIPHMQTRRVLVLIAFALVMTHAHSNLLAQDARARKTWTFHSRSGDVEIEATAWPNTDGTTRATLSISSGYGVSRSVTEEAGFLAVVLDDLPKEGLTDRSVTVIQLRLNESEARRRVAVYAAQSPIWRGSLRTRNPASFYPLIVSFMNASGAYVEWNDVFGKHGLKLKVVGVEKVMLEQFSKLDAECPAGANCRNLLVPSDALVQINVTPAASR
jgi:hypothetical protein